MSAGGRKRDPIWLAYSVLVKTAEHKIERVKCNKCGFETIALVARMKKHILEKCTQPHEDKENNTSNDTKKITTSSSTLRQIDEISSNTETENNITPITSSAVGNVIEKTNNNLVNETTSTPNPEEIILQSSSSFTNVLDNQNDSVTITATKSTTAKKLLKIDNYIIKAKTKAKEIFDEQIARFFFSSSICLKNIENIEFMKLCQLLRPGYHTPTERTLSNTFLDKVIASEQLKCAKKLSGEFVCISINGCTQNEEQTYPAISIKLSKDDGEVILIEAINTTGKECNIKYYSDLAIYGIRKIEKEYKCTIGSILIDNIEFAGTNPIINIHDSPDIFSNPIEYCCSTLILQNLRDELKINYRRIQSDISLVFEYFSREICTNNAENKKNFVLIYGDEDEKMCKFFKNYIKNWPHMMTVIISKVFF